MEWLFNIFISLKKDFDTDVKIAQNSVYHNCFSWIQHGFSSGVWEIRKLTRISYSLSWEPFLVPSFEIDEIKHLVQLIYVVWRIEYTVCLHRWINWQDDLFSNIEKCSICSCTWTYFFVFQRFTTFYSSFANTCSTMLNFQKYKTRN